MARKKKNNVSPEIRRNIESNVKRSQGARKVDNSKYGAYGTSPAYMNETNISDVVSKPRAGRVKSAETSANVFTQQTQRYENSFSVNDGGQIGIPGFETMDVPVTTPEISSASSAMRGQVGLETHNQVNNQPLLLTETAQSRTDATNARLNANASRNAQAQAINDRNNNPSAITQNHMARQEEIATQEARRNPYKATDSDGQIRLFDDTPVQSPNISDGGQLSLFGDTPEITNPKAMDNQMNLFEGENYASAFQDPQKLADYEAVNGTSYFDEARQVGVNPRGAVPSDLEHLSNDDLEFLSQVDSNFQNPVKTPSASGNTQLTINDLDTADTTKAMSKMDELQFQADIAKEMKSISSEPLAGAIPTEPKIKKKFGKSGDVVADAVENAGKKVNKKVVQEGTEGMLKGMSKSKIGKTIAGVGVAALLVSNMNKSKGQQSNQELYGQRTPYM